MPAIPAPHDGHTSRQQPDSAAHTLTQEGPLTVPTTVTDDDAPGRIYPIGRAPSRGQ